MKSTLTGAWSRMILSLPLIWILLGNTPANANESYDPIKEAVFLLQNQDTSTAKALISKLEPGLDKVDLGFLHGMTAFYEKRFVEAEQKLGEAWHKQFRSHHIDLFLCQSLLELKKEVNCEIYFPSLSQWSAKHYALAFRSNKAQNNLPKAWSVLQNGLLVYANERLLLVEKAAFLIEQDLLNEAESFLKSLNARSSLLDLDDRVALSILFRQKKQSSTASWLLEEARLISPQSKKVILELVQTYAQQGKFLSAAEVLQSYSRFDNKYLLETAELFRRAKAYARALSINQFVVQEKEKIKQRFIIHMDLGSYSSAANMRKDLQRLGLIEENEDLAYGLAFALFQEKQLLEAEQVMARIQRPDLMKKIAWIRQSIEACQSKNWECIL